MINVDKDIVSYLSGSILKLRSPLAMNGRKVSLDPAEVLIEDADRKSTVYNRTHGLLLVAGVFWTLLA